MGFHQTELERIKRATGGLFKKQERNQVARALLGLLQHFQGMSKWPEEAIVEELSRLQDHYRRARHVALQNGAQGYGDGCWAAAAACESWVATLLSGTDQDKFLIDSMARDLIRRGGIR